MFSKLTGPVVLVWARAVYPFPFLSYQGNALNLELVSFLGWIVLNIFFLLKLVIQHEIVYSLLWDLEF